jgi:hypothetical protein
MGTEFGYVLPVGETGWRVNGAVSTIFRWDYDVGRESLLTLYEKGKRQQWNAAERIDWSLDLDPENPVEIDDRVISIFGSDIWNRMNAKERANLRRHSQAWQFSQFLHGEQGALVCCAKIVQQTPDLDAKFFAATQAMDEARHVEAFSRLLREKFEVAYPITPPLRSLLEGVVSDSRWDVTYLGMQVLIEGLALAAFQLFRDEARNPLAASINAFVMQDEARHVAFGRLALRDYYPQLSDAERAEREDFVVESCYHLRDRFLADELWEVVGLPKKECLAVARESERLKLFRSRLFSRIVPMIRDIGLLGPKVEAAFADMGVLGFTKVDLGALLARDAEVADGFDTSRPAAAQ